MKQMDYNNSNQIHYYTKKAAGALFSIIFYNKGMYYEKRNEIDRSRSGWNNVYK